MQNEDVKVLNIKPVGSSVDPSLQQALQGTAQAMQETLNGFSEEVPSDSEEVKKAKGFLNQFTEYIKGESFKRDINDTAKKYNIPPKKLAENFFGKALGTIGDVLGIAIGTVGNAGHMLVDLLSTIAHGAVNLIVNVANALARVFTLNRTCIA
jgi:hypothetical protein